MHKFVIAGLLFAVSSSHAAVPPSTPDTAFKLATYDTGGEPMLGMVIADHVIEISGANADLTRAEDLPVVDIPNEMRALIERYADTKARLYQIANYYAGDGLSERSFVHPLDEIHLQAPIKYPYNLLAVAANYQDHAAEMSRRYGNFNPEPVDPDRSNPVLFAKSPRSTIIDPGSPYPIPPTTKVFDYENELAIVVGKPATRVTLENAGDYIFGYTMMFDVSSRDNPDEPEEEQVGFDFGVNWFEAKSRDNSAPMGPFITPREFIGDPANLRIVTRVNGVTKQDGNSKDMIHNEAYLLRHATSILTLYPGDVLASGTPAGVGSAKNPPEFLSRGDKVEMTIEGIGTMVTPIE